jgi:coenzyme F420-reducing hydrogenase gamma subunit
MMGAAGDPMKTLKCAFGFIACAKEKCNVAEEITAVANDDIIEKLKECKEANDKCMAGALSMKDKATCYMGYGMCIGKDLAACAGPCLPQSAWCMMGARGNWKAMMACGMQFVNCARKECMKNDLRQLA